MVSLKDIAVRCGVSVATVSKALSDRGDIAESTKTRIRDAAMEMGYMANAAARALRTRRSYNLGVLFSDAAGAGLSQEFFASVLENFRNYAEEKGYDITFIQRFLGEQQTACLKHCEYRGLDGVAVICADMQDPQVWELVNSRLPTVVLDALFDHACSVLSDNSRGQETLVRYAYACGHRRIAYIHGGDGFVTDERLSGFNRALRDLGLSVPEEYVIKSAYHDIAGCREATRALLSLKQRPTCILFPDDYSYLGGMSAITEAGLGVPEDISVIAYDGLQMARVLGVCTYAQDVRAIGRTAARKLIEAIEHPEAPREHVMISGELLKGSSVKKLS